MHYRNLGRAGVKVSSLCLGTMNFGNPTDEQESIRIIHAAIDAGINFIDTANVYNNGLSEEIVGRALQGRRDKIVLATKVFGKMGEGPNDRGCSRFHIMQQVEASLKRLQTNHIDLYQLHRPDPDTPLDESLSAMTDLVRQGKVRYIGTSTYPAWQLCETLWISERLGHERFICEQPPYNILLRAIEREVLPFCRAHGFAVIPWGPLAAGRLSGKYHPGQPLPEGSRGVRREWDMNKPENRRWAEAVEKIGELATECGCSITQFSLAWLLHQPGVTAPIIGPRSMEQFHDNITSVECSISEELLKKVDTVVPPETDMF